MSHRLRNPWEFRSVLAVLACLGMLAAIHPRPLLGGEPFPSPDVRAKRFAERNNPEPLAELARDFLGMVRQDGLPGDRNVRAPLTQAMTALKEDRPDEALKLYHAYFLQKLCAPEKFGIDPASVHSARTLTAPPDVTAADRLLNGFWGEAEIGLPGNVNWLHPHTNWEELNPPEPGGLPAHELMTATAFTPLATAYLATGDEKYIRAWVAYIDDWALNSTVTGVHPHPCLVSIQIRGTLYLPAFLKTLSGLASIIPNDRLAELLPPATLARFLNKYWNELILNQALYLRTNTHNWTPGSADILLSLVFDEFKPAQFLWREARRRQVEDHAVTQNLRDGSENQQCIWYNHNYFNVDRVMSLLKERRQLPKWAEFDWVAEVGNDPLWFQEIREHLASRVGFLIRLQTPQGVLPIGVRGVGRPGGSADFLVSPEAFADPELQRVVQAMNDAKRPAYERTFRAGSGIRPSYHSEWFPYGGYNLVREGWESDSGYGLLFCSPAPGAYGGRRSRSNNNVFGLAAFGQDLVVEADIAPRQLEGAGGAMGFETALPGGGTVRYLAAPGDEPVVLELGGVRIEGEALLVTAHGGVALGCRSLAIHGKTVPVDRPDFEFSLDPEPRTPNLVPIYRPIAPVDIGPARNVFIDEVKLTMANKTLGVDIRYTLDGTDPTPRSTRYEGPFLLRHNAVVKARAYRPGVTENPPQHSGTHATEVSRAVFNRELPVPAVAPLNPRPGLKARYYEADWRRLWLRLDSLAPVAETTGVAAFDLSVVPESNPPLGEAPAPRARFFAIEYTGYIHVPETGVYTLHAPREYVMPDIDAGYELTIQLGQKWKPHGWRTQAFGLNEWYPSTRLHAQGNWSIALEKGLQPIRIVYLDYRADAVERLNHPGLRLNTIADVPTPDLRVSGPGVERAPIPAEWFFRGR